MLFREIRGFERISDIPVWGKRVRCDIQCKRITADDPEVPIAQSHEAERLNFNANPTWNSIFWLELEHFFFGLRSKFNRKFTFWLKLKQYFIYLRSTFNWNFTIRLRIDRNFQMKVELTFFAWARTWVGTLFSGLIWNIIFLSLNLN